MTIQQVTTNRSYPKPNVANQLVVDVERLRLALDAIDTDMAARPTSTAVDTLISAAIANVIAGAPGALDTLDELAAALGDNANFAATVANSLASINTALGDRYTKAEADARYVQGAVQVETMFTAAAGQVAFGLTSPIINKPSALVTVDGVVQPTSEYSISQDGLTLTLSEAPGAGAAVRVLALSVAAAGAPADEEEIVPVDAMSGEMGPDMGAEVEEDEIDLEELLAELDSLDESDELEEAKKKKTKEDEDKEDKKEKMEEGKVSDFLDKVFGLGLSCVNTYNAAIKAAGGDKQAEKVAMTEFRKCMKEKAGGIDISGTGSVVGGFGQSGKSAADVYENEELAEAIETINTLRSELNEVNLLNAKLLYVNKLFKAKNLTESQKLKVIASFDKATNVKEANENGRGYDATR